MTRSRSGVTLVEMLVVVALVGVLLGILLPSLQAARESVRQTSCANNLRQLGLAAAGHEAARGRYPVGAESREWAEQPQFPHQFFRWSVLAHLAPFYEEESLLEDLDLTVPLYTNFGADAVAPQNREVVARTVPLFLCPSDRGRPVSPIFGPTNYAACTGSGGGGGTPFDTDGVFSINSRTRPKDMKDGLSKTVLFSESTLGDGPVATADPAAANPDTAYAFTFFTPLSDTRCSRARNWNFTDLRGFSWANGEYRTTLYNHERSPNDSEIDCLGVLMNTPDIARLYAGYGWRAARSRHRGGVNVTFADTAVRFVDDAVDPVVWKAAATRAGGEASPRLGGP
jgi:prepilin-type N-terminal cleavage/methylation domain-containing protein/prepilin-type processing-associated H-X9-DG protein